MILLRHGQSQFNVVYNVTASMIRALTGQRVPNGHLLRFDILSGEASDLAPVATT
jgi:hypothetical protein